MREHTYPPAPAELPDAPELPAGEFSAWLRRTRSAQRAGGSANVPCGECIGCCTSAYFIHIGPGESETLRRIPQALLFPAPGLPKGNVILGYDQHGRCPMLVEGRCSIYADRPQTCRSYDCRVFAAAGLGPGPRDSISRRVRSWKFAYPAEQDHQDHAAVRAAGKFLRERADCFPAGFVPSNEAQLAALAIKVYEVFSSGSDAPHGAARTRPDNELAAAVVAKLRQLEREGEKGGGTSTPGDLAV